MFRNSSVWFGSQQLLRTMHTDEMRKMREAEDRAAREQHAERASRLREMMENSDLVRMVVGFGGR